MLLVLVLMLVLVLVLLLVLMLALALVLIHAVITAVRRSPPAGGQAPSLKSRPPSPSAAALREDDQHDGNTHTRPRPAVSTRVLGRRTAPFSTFPYY